jgi:anti-sigma regulatory factor (Ser/Thr protein kinase)
MPHRPHRLSIPSRTSELARVRRTVALWAAEAGLPEADAFALQLAVDEAVANAIEHGFGGRPDGRVVVEAALDAAALTIAVRHRGRPFDPARQPMADLRTVVAERRPHGYGLHLMRRLVDELAFLTAGGANEVRLTKRRPGRGAEGDGAL